jgi:hypothetical protein
MDDDFGIDNGTNEQNKANPPPNKVRKGNNGSGMDGTHDNSNGNGDKLVQLDG